MSKSKSIGSESHSGKKQRRLGRGLADLIRDSKPISSVSDKPQDKSGISMIAIDNLFQNNYNPRKQFDQESLEELVQSIESKGIIQPITVRKKDESGKYEIVAGERRWRACQIAGLQSIPSYIIELDDKGAAEVAIIENVQRDNINPIEEAMGYDNLRKLYGYTQSEIASIIGKSRVHITNTIRLLKLPFKVTDLVVRGLISAGHARALIGSDNPELLADIIIRKSLNVREAERLANQSKQNKLPSSSNSKRVAVFNEDARDFQKRLINKLGMKVSLCHYNDDSGELKIRYEDNEQYIKLRDFLYSG